MRGAQVASSKLTCFTHRTVTNDHPSRPARRRTPTRPCVRVGALRCAGPRVLVRPRRGRSMARGGASGSRARGELHAHRRTAAAAAYALEDQFAGPAHEQHVAIAPQKGDGSLEAVIAARGIVAGAAAHFERVVAEPALAPRPGTDGWRWDAADCGGGFVRRSDGAMFATGASTALAPELALALEHAARTQTLTSRVDVAF